MQHFQSEHRTQPGARYPNCACPTSTVYAVTVSVSDGILHIDFRCDRCGKRAQSASPRQAVSKVKWQELVSKAGQGGAS